MATNHNSRPIGVPEIIQHKSESIPVTALTASDYISAALLDEAGIDIILVGDSLSMVVQGNDTTIPVTLDEMIYHTRCVSRAVRHALVIGDMPFGSYQASVECALHAATRFMKEGGAGAVKLEGGVRMSAQIAGIVSCEIPVMGHIGLTPQSYHRMGGFRVQGRLSSEGIFGQSTRDEIIADAIAVEEAGAFSLVIECVPEDLAAEITRRLSIPTIGIGAGPHCDGQILVLQDMLGMTEGKSFRFVKRYAELAEEIRGSVKKFASEVRKGVFPSFEHSFSDHPAVERNPHKSIICVNGGTHVAVQENA